ncbi:hypothetical protein FVE85_2321 [Porphyridium purpureum]|uniref:Uncharacterized protein n=1 Tax=Porphyridium purpureum TaxID=35688 RepID=A0A5J4YXT4_PORPP|nr:hypothetical protein FVE85_2321 [Porphyridium purpureum]|eukprot:POR5844..scf209_3
MLQTGDVQDRKLEQAMAASYMVCMPVGAFTAIAEKKKKSAPNVNVDGKMLLNDGAIRVGFEYHCVTGWNFKTVRRCACRSEHCSTMSYGSPIMEVHGDAEEVDIEDELKVASQFVPLAAPQPTETNQIWQDIPDGATRLHINEMCRGSDNLAEMVTIMPCDVTKRNRESGCLKKNVRQALGTTFGRAFVHKVPHAIGHTFTSLAGLLATTMPMILVSIGTRIRFFDCAQSHAHLPPWHALRRLEHDRRLCKRPRMQDPLASSARACATRHLIGSFTFGAKRMANETIITNKMRLF